MSPELPGWLTIFFVVLVVWAVCGAGFLLKRSGAVQSNGRLLLGIAIWLCIPAAVAASGALANFDTLPPRVPLLFFPMTLLTTWLACSRMGTLVGLGLPLGSIIGVQVFRVPLEFALHELHVFGALPIEMTYSGRNFDILSGLVALLLWAWSKRAPIPRALAWAWAFGGLGLLITIVTLALLSFPAPFGWFEPPNRIVAYWPWVWLPTVHVQVALFGQIVVIRQLWRTRASLANR